MDIDGVENKYTKGFVGDAPRMPTPDLLGNGEIALNIHKGTESLFFKNDAGEIIRFKRVPDWADIANKPAYLGSTFFSPTANYIGVRTPSRTAGQYYEFWDNGIGWAGIKAKNFQPDGGQANHFLKGDGSLDGNKYWHAGNFNPANKKDAYSNSLLSFDTRGTASLPKSQDAGVYFDFKNASIEGLRDEGTYIGSMLFRPYGGGTDFSGGSAHQLGFSSRGDIFHRIGSGETWNDWNKFWDSGNFNPATKADIAHTHELEYYRFKQINFATSPHDFAHIKIDRTTEEVTHMDFTVGDDAGQDDFRFFVNHWQSPTPIEVFEINAWGAVTDRLISKRLDVEMWALKQIGNELCICFNEIIVAKFNPLQGFISMKDVAATGIT